MLRRLLSGSSSYNVHLAAKVETMLQLGSEIGIRSSAITCIAKSAQPQRSKMKRQDEYLWGYYVGLHSAVSILPTSQDRRCRCEDMRLSSEDI